VNAACVNLKHHNPIISGMAQPLLDHPPLLNARLIKRSLLALATPVAQVISQAEREIDTLVYQLVNLTPDEIRLIEAGAP
jgi:hypothetical protein